MLKPTAFLLILFLLPLPGVLLHAQSPQTWRSANGAHAFEGTLVRREGANLILRGANGQEIVVPLAALDEASQRQAGADSPNPASAAAVFEHRNPHLRFAMYPQREWLKVQFLRAGAPVEPHSYTLTFHYQEASGSERPRAVRIEGMEGTVVESGGEAHLRIRMVSGTVVRLSVAVNQQNRLQFRYGIEKVGEGVSLDSAWMQVGMEIPTMFEFDVEGQVFRGPLAPNGVTREQMPPLLNGYELRLVNPRGEQEVLPYAVGRERGGQGREMILALGPRNPGLRVSSLSEDGSGKLGVSFYGGKLPAFGYNISMQWIRKEGARESQPFTLQLR